MNKRGAFDFNIVVYLAIGVLVVGSFVYVFWGNPFQGDTDFIGPKLEASNTVGFDSLWENERAVFFNYIFGKVPSFLIDWTSGISASIIIIGIWLLLLLAFGDILTLFSIFSKPIAWISSVILTIIVANIKGVIWLTVMLLAVTSIFGSLAVIAGIMTAFGMFLAFHWGTSSLRRKMIIRRAEDQALRTVAGGKKIASGATVLAEVAEAARRAAAGP